MSVGHPGVAVANEESKFLDKDKDKESRHPEPRVFPVGRAISLKMT
jgi:hypothetical protein